MKKNAIFFMPAFFLVLAIFAAAIPYGSVTIWAQTIVGITVLISALLYIIIKPIPARKSPRSLIIKISLSLLLCWIAAHTTLSHFAIISIPNTGNTPILISKLYILIACITASWIASRLSQSRRILNFIVISIVIIGTFEAALGIVSLYTDMGAFSLLTNGNRAIGTFSSGNSFGGFLAISLLITVGTTLSILLSTIGHITRRGMNILHVSTKDDYILLGAISLVIATIIQVIAIVLSGSRGTLLSVACTLPIILVWFGFSNTKKKSLRYTIILLILISLVMLTIGVGGTYNSSISRLQELGDTHEAALPRLVIWKGAVSLIATYPLGIGLGAFPNTFSLFQPTGFNNNRIYHAHNDYLEFLSELGIPGMLLLIIPLIYMILIAWKFIYRPATSKSIWIRRSALLAVLSALIHASFDFNISSRPGVTILFFIALGIAISRPFNQASRSSVHNPIKSSDKSRSRQKSNHFTKNKIFIYISIIILIFPLIIHQTRLTASIIIMRQGFSALGGVPPIYYMLPPKIMTPEKAISKLELATKIMPKYSHLHAVLGRGRLRAHARKREALVNQSIVDNPEVPEETLSRQISIMLRLEEINTLKKAHEDLQTALKLAPDSLDANSNLARVLGRLAYLADSPENFHSYSQNLLKTSRYVQTLSPNDSTSNRLIFIATSQACHSAYIDSDTELKKELIEQVKLQGLHLLQLNGNMVKDVISSFTSLGIEPSVMLISRNMHIPVIWKVYQHYIQNDNITAALSTLRHLSIAIESNETISNVFNSDQLEAQKNTYKSKVIIEQSKLFLRLQDFNNYTNLSAARTETLKTYIDKNILQTHKNSEPDSKFQYLTLDRLRDLRGLDPENRMKCYKLAQDYDASIDRLNSIISPMAFLSQYNQSFAKHFDNVQPPEGFQHRLKLINITNHINNNENLIAKNELIELFSTNKLDPDIPAFIIKYADQLRISDEIVSQALDRIKDLSPEYFVGMNILGGRIEMTGITVDPNYIQTYWRFRSPVSSDIQVLAIFRDHNNKTVYSRAIDFTKHFPVQFGNGSPTLGSVFKVNFKLPTSVANSSRMIVGLRSKSTRNFIYSEEGLPYAEFYNWMDLSNYQHIFRNQEFPSPSVCKSLGIEKLLPKKKFSHNLQRIYNEPEFYPLLNNVRTTTTPVTWQPCLSATGLVDHAVSAANKAFNENPLQTMFALGINDGQEWCQCDSCKSLFPKDQQNKPASLRWWGEPYWSFVNKVATELYSSHPDKRVGAIAYSNVVKPPTFNLQSNITVYVCQDAGTHFELKKKNRDARRLEEWVNVCSDVGLYNYAGLVSWIFPRYCRDEIAADIRLASELGVDKFYIEDSWVRGLDGPLPWITKKLIQNPKLDALTLQRVYCKQAFGPAAETMHLYFNYLQKVWQTPTKGKWFDGLFKIEEQVMRYPPDVRKRMYTYINNAQRMASGNNAILRRINAIASPLQLSEAFATEYEIMHKLKKPITDIESLQDSETKLQDLYNAISKRNDLLKSIMYLPWGKDAARALASNKTNSTFSRWAKKQNILIEDTERIIRIIRSNLKAVYTEENKNI